jgi:hypothetical protein
LEFSLHFNKDMQTRTYFLVVPVFPWPIII